MGSASTCFGFEASCLFLEDLGLSSRALLAGTGSGLKRSALPCFSLRFSALFPSGEGTRSTLTSLGLTGGGLGVGEEEGECAMDGFGFSGDGVKDADLECERDSSESDPESGLGLCHFE